MHKFLQITFILILAASLSSTTHAQTSWTGIPAFSTQLVSETDSINPANLNVHVVMPNFSKPGRGLSLNNVFSYDSLVWVIQNDGYPNYTVHWLPPSGNITISAAGIFGRVAWTHTTGICGPSTNGQNQSNSNYIYYDPFGASHYFPNSSVAIYTCDNNQHAWPGGTVGPANDGSGYKLYLSPAPDISATVIAPDGTTSGPSDMSGVYFTSTTDYNGNQITSSNSGLTDTLGTIALEGSSYPSPTNPATYVGATGTYTSYTLRSNFGCAGVNEFVGQLPTSVITRITLADGSYYAFAYEPTPGYPGYITGRMASIRYPSGATVTYTYTGANYGINCNDGSTMGLTRVTPDGTWTYTRSGSSTTVVDPQGNQTIYDFATVQYASPWSYYTVSQAPLMEVRRRVYQGSGTLLKTVETCYNSAAFPCTGTSISLPVARRTVRTELPDSSGLVSELDTYYDTATYSLVTEVDEYDFRTGGSPPTPVRKTLTTYASFASNPNITNRPLTVTVQDGSGNVKSQTTYAYDETAVTPTTGTPQHVSVSGSRGNPTTITYLVQGSTTVHRTKTYFDTGTVNTETDFAGNFTTYAYGTSSCGNSFPTQVTLPLNHIKSATWDCNGGVLTSATDENSKTTSYIYGDPSFWRLTQVNYPDGGQITATYNQGTTSPWNIVQNKKITSSLTLSQKTVYDSLGRVSQQQLTSDPQGTVLTDTTYDSVGRVATVSNPYRSTGDPAYGITTYKYDALGRTCVVVPPDGTAISGSTCPTTQPANDLSTTYSANTTTVTDQAGKSRKSVTDGLGRLTQVFEDPASFNYETDYSYDTLNNLLTVNQKGGSTNSANWRTRTFSYNSLSQLLTAANPESGAVTYAYDANGNLLQKTSPAPNQTGSATVTLSYCYDVLNRLTAKGYTFSPNTPPTCSNGTLPSPVATYSYDQTNCLSQPSCFNVGRRTGMTDAAGSELWAYDSMGRPLADQRTTNGIMKPTTYTYNLDGSVATLAYPSGRVITYTPNAAGRTISAVDSTGPINYATAAAYAPTGALSSLTNGASLVSTFYFNNRVQPCRISVKNTGTAPASCTDAATGNVLDFSYCSIPICLMRIVRPTIVLHLPH